MSLTKAAIVEQVCTELDVQRKDAIDILEALLEILKSTLESGEDVMVSGFGKFQVKEKKARKGRNPATGDDAILPARRVVTFKWSGKLRDKVNWK